MADPPGNSSIQFDMLFPIGIKALQYGGKGYQKTMNSDWGDYYAVTCMQLQSGTSPQALADKLTQIHIKNQPGADASK